MNFQVDPEWWKGVFDELYLATDHRTVCNSRLTSQEVDLIESLIPLEKTFRILDMCGGHGRHCLDLDRRGYRNTICLDYSPHLLRHGRQCAGENAAAVEFLRTDARNTGLKGKTFDAVVMMTNSFGYFADNQENIQILTEAHRLLKSSGYLLLDLLNPDYVRSTFKSSSWHEVEPDLVVCRRRRIQENIIMAREMIFSKSEGLIRENCYCAHLYTAADIRSLLKSAGLNRIEVTCGRPSPDRDSDRGFMENRMIAVARKPKG